MFLFTSILCVKCNVLYIGGPNVQVQGGPNHLAPALVSSQQSRNKDRFVKFTLSPPYFLSGFYDTVSIDVIAENTLPAENVSAAH